MQIRATHIEVNSNRNLQINAECGLELNDNGGAMKSVSAMSNSGPAIFRNEKVGSELHYNAGVESIDNVSNQTKPNRKDKTMKPQNETTTSEAPAATATKRSKANYDVVKGLIIGCITAAPGITLNGLNKELGTNSNHGYKFPVIYAGVKQLREAEPPVVFGTKATKNEGLYLSAADALKNKPEPRAAAARKSDSKFVLEKLIEVGATKELDKYKVIEGNDEQGPIMEAFKTASTVPGTVFRVIDNSGDEPKVLEAGKVMNRKAAIAKKEAPATTEEPATV
jgi:hypothetical protein